MSQIKITPALLNDLRQKAEAYELKEWYVGDYRQKKAEGCNLKEWYVGDLLVLAGFGYNMTSVAQTLDPQNAEYIAAASPAVVLALVAEVEWQTAQHIEEMKNCIDLQKIIDDLKKEFEDLKDRCDC